MLSQAWIAFGSALLGATVGGAASFAAALVVDRYRLRRETRVRIYDQLMYDALGEVARRVRLAEEGGTDTNPLEALARLRRAAVIAGKKDIKQIAVWQPPYEALIDLELRIMRLLPEGSAGGGGDREKLDALLDEVKTYGYEVIDGLYEYSKWLEGRLAAPVAGTPPLSERTS